MDKNIDSKTLAIEIAKILDKKKAQDVRVLKVDSLTVLTDYFVIASGTSCAFFLSRIFAISMARVLLSMFLSIDISPYHCPTG